MANFTGTDAAETLTGTTDPDVLNGLGGSDTLLGGDNADVLLGGGGSDSVTGGHGDDTAFLGNGNDVFVWSPGDGNDVVEGDNGYDTLLFNGANVAESFDIAANGARVRFFRNVANITMDLGAVEQIDINALGGADSITIGDLTGTTLQRINVNLFATGGVSGDGAADRVSVNGGAGNDILSISTGSAAKVVVTGAEAVNDAFYVFGFAGQDTIVAGGFDFALTIDGGTESDTISYAGATAGVTVNLLNPALNDGVAAKHTYVSIESVIGSAFDDFLIGTNESNTLDGGASADYLQGLNGDDTYIVDADDVVIETANGGTADRVLAMDSYKLTGPARVEILETINANSKTDINLTGNAFAQTIIGNRGDNKLSGKAGNDILDGGKGNDKLDGGDGRDTFVFDTKLKSSNIDTIKHYVKADDRIMLDNDIFTALTATGKLSKDAFYASFSGAAHDFNDRIIYDTDDGKLYYDKDGLGNGAAIHFATISGHPTLTAHEFVIV
jgi:Ca2+-binding RTX toxin-like protein